MNADETASEADTEDSHGLPPAEEGSNDPEGAPAAEGEPETFDREYVEKLRKESADYRTRAKRADDLQARLVAAVVREAAGSLLEDPSDLLLYRAEAELLDDDGMPDADKIAEAAQDLASQRPHLARRRLAGDIDQGARSESESVDLAGILRQGAS